MYILFIFTILFSQIDAFTMTNDSDLYMNKGLYLYHIVTKFEHWGNTNPCNESMSYYQTHDNVSLTHERIDELNFCLGQIYWFRKEYNDENPFYPSECNLLMLKAGSVNWLKLRLSVKKSYLTCIKRRLYKREKLLNHTVKRDV